MTLLAELYEALRAKFPPNRVVAILTPIVFAPAAGAVAVWVATNLSWFPALDASQVTAVFVAGATAAVTAAYKWTDGWIAYERREAFAPEIDDIDADVAREAADKPTG